MKKMIVFFILIFVFALNFCFAHDYKIAQEQQNQYRNDIYKTIDKELHKTKIKINKEVSDAQRTYKKYLKDKNKSKNQDKYIFEIQDCQRGIEVHETTFISILIDITNKYKNINSDIPPTDFPRTLIEFISPYFEANDIDYSKIKELDSYSANKIKELDYLMEQIY